MPVPDKVVRAVKKDFGVELTEAEIAAIETRRDLYYVLERRFVAAEREQPCRSMQVFHRLRRALVDCFGVDRRAVTPDTPVAKLLPNRHPFPEWRNLRRASDVPLPLLRPSPWPSIGAGCVVAIPIGMTVLLLVTIAGAMWDPRSPGLTIGALVALGLVGLAVFAYCRGVLRGARARPRHDPSRLTLRELIRERVEHPENRSKALWARVWRYRLPLGSWTRLDQWAAMGSREALREGLAAYMREGIWSFEFDDAIQRVEGKNPSLYELSIALWMLYDDIRDHPIEVAPAVWQLLRRILAALTTDLPLEIKSYPPIDPDNPPPELDYQPFWNAEQWRQYESLLEQYDLPDYDVAVHAWRMGVSSDMLSGPYYEWDESGCQAFMVGLPAMAEPVGAVATPPAPPSP